ncbi:MAG: Lrp/AsnC family transcriptional regulator [Promethearchaeota archaeon]
MLDSKDHKIIKELRKDASQPAVTLARKLRMPRSTLQHRINRLQKAGIIQRIAAIPNYEKIGLPVTAIVLLTYSPTSKVSQQDVARAIAQLENVAEVHVVAGQWDIILKARGSSLQEIGELVVNKLRQIEGVGQTVTCGCFFTLKEEP